MKKIVILIVLIVLLAFYTLYVFNYIPHKKYTNKDFNIETYISDIERFQRSISLANVQKIADALETETYLLFVEQ